jgi:hypothetical protein
MTVFPEAKEVKEVAQLLLALADSPRDVSTTLDPTIGFTVPGWLYEKFVETWDVRDTAIRETIPAGDDKPVKAVVEASEPIEEAPEPARRKAGRPRKEDK